MEWVSVKEKPKDHGKCESNGCFDEVKEDAHGDDDAGEAVDRREDGIAAEKKGETGDEVRPTRVNDRTEAANDNMGSEESPATTRFSKTSMV